MGLKKNPLVFLCMFRFGSRYMKTCVLKPEILVLLVTSDCDTLIVKSSKKSPLLSRMVILVFAMVFGVYLYSICLKQISPRAKIKFLNAQVIESPCHDHDINLSQIPSVHYPKPETFSRAECEHNPVRFFAILSMQRSGSGWFETLLNSHINVSSNGEIFSVKDRRKNISSIVQTLDKVYNLDWFSSASKNQCSAAVGFKWMLNQIQEEQGYCWESPEQIVMEHCFGRALVRSWQSGSSLLLSAPKAEILSKYKPLINSRSLINDLKDMEVTTAKVLEYFNSTRHILLYYEDLTLNRTKLKAVQEFLKLPLMELTSRQIKIHKGPLSDHVKNWEDVNMTLTGTAYESFLHSDY
ncbi:Nodulation protein H [Morella rubra]|uniref:Nodulation protein H n=1 Tax=Morella rubra TaxID=262757 RepID=A0A6A1VRS9_9ROSI|nr:Nodulation protein H [Morella rubra]